MALVVLVLNLPKRFGMFVVNLSGGAPEPIDGRGLRSNVARFIQSTVANPDAAAGADRNIHSLGRRVRRIGGLFVFSFAASGDQCQQ